MTLFDPAAVRCIVADPPWSFADKLGRRGAAANYHTLTSERIQWHASYWPLVTAPRNCVLFLWRVAAMQQEALDVLRAWGFSLKGEIVWNKLTRHGKPHFGMGRIVRASHETCLIGVRGRVRVRNRSIRDRFDAPVGRHSEKPELFYDMVERLVAGPYLELFARRKRPGWTCLGRQVNAPRVPATRTVRRTA